MTDTDVRQRLRLTRPCEEYREGFAEMVREFREAGENDYPHLGDRFLEKWDETLDYVRNGERGEGVPEGLVPSTNFWVLRGGRVIGSANFRHRLNDTLMNHGGNIGYCIRPSERGRGYATAVLQMVLDEARRMGLEKVLVTCATHNEASRRVIEKNGGVFEDIRTSTESGVPVRRYWIDLSGRPGETGEQGQPEGQSGIDQ